MKTVYDLSLLDGVLSDIPNGSELEAKLKERIEKQTRCATYRERFIQIPISGNSECAAEFEYLDCYIALHLKRVYSTKTWKPIKDIYTLEAYKIEHAERKTIWEDYHVKEYVKALVPRLSDIEEVDTEGNRI